MKKSVNLFILLLFLFISGTTHAQVTGFTLSPSGPTFYKTNTLPAVSDITVAVSVGATPLAAGNLFKVEMSLADGSFPGTFVEVVPVAGGTVASSITNVLVNIPNSKPSTVVADNGYRFRVVWDNGTGSFTNFSSFLPSGPTPWFRLEELPIINITAAGLLPGGVTGTKFCEGSQVTFGVTAGTFTKVGNFGGSNIFFLDVSDEFGNFSTDWYQGSQVGIGSIVSSFPNVIYGIIPTSLTAPPTPGSKKAGFNFGTGHRFRIRSSNPVAYSNILSSYEIINTPGLAVPVLGQWTAYVYSDRVTPYIQFDKYSGAFNAGTANSIGANTFYSIGGSPSQAGGYVGCAVGTDYHSVNYKRTQFTCGFYQFDVDVDDECKILVDGVQVYAKTTAGAATDVWRCFLGPTSTVEFKVSDKIGNSTHGLTLTALASSAALQSIANPTVCTGNSATLTAVPVTGANINTGTLTYSWSPATDLSATTGASVVSTPTANRTYTVTATNTATGCTSVRTVNVTVVASLTVSISPAGPTTICPGAGVTLTASGATSYTWSPATGLNTTSGATVIATPAATTTYTVTGTSGACSATSTRTVTVGPALGAPVAGNGTWNVYAYSNSGSTAAGGFAVLLGSYTHTALNYDTRTRWAQNSSPSSANATGGTAYVGCPVPNDYHSYKYWRTNFPCGIYQITINENNDNVTLFVDGVQKFTRASSGTATNVWRGFLGPNSDVDIRSVELTSASFTSVNVVLVDAITMIDPVICVNVSTTLTATTTPDGPDAQANTSYVWTQTGGPVNTLTGSGSSVNFPATPTTGTYTYRVDITNNLVGNPDATCTVFDFVTVTVTNAIPIGTITPNPATICGGASVVLTASGGNLYQWYYMDSTTIKDGSNTIVGNPGVDNVHWKAIVAAGGSPSFLTPVIAGSNLNALLSTNGSVRAAPLVSTRYAAIVSVGGACPTGFAYVNVFVGAPSNPSSFIPNLWYAYCYDNNNFTNYYGYYTITAASFDTGTRWNTNNSPSSANAVGGAAYQGCAIANDDFSINFKRQGFTCGFYQISFLNNDDEINLRIGAGDPFGTTTTALATVAGFPKAYSGTGYSNVWRGFLGTASQIEMTLREFSGGAGVNIQISDITAAVQTTLITSAPVVACQGSSAILTASLAGNAVPASIYTYTWTSSSPDITFSPFSGTSATGLGPNVNAIVSGAAANQFVTITCTVTDNITGCSVTQTKPAQIEINTTFTTTLTSDKTSICSGELATLTAAGASLYDWDLTVGAATGATFRFPNATGTVNPATTFPAGAYVSTLAGSYGNVVLFSPGSALSYKIQVTGKTGGTCTSGTAVLDITIINTLVSDPGYGNGKWNVVCYNGTSPTISPYLSNGTGSIGTSVRGYYDETELSFSTEARWDKNLAPSIPTVNTTSGAGYVGCALNNDNHTVVYKRTNIPCNIYRIDIGDFSNALDLIVNGVVVFTSPVGLSQKFNAWNGSLSPTDEVEVRMYHTTGASNYSVNFAVIPPPAASVIWTGGGGNADWQNVNNWCAGLPERVTNVFIPAGTAFNPVVNSLLAATIPIECYNLNLAPGATLTINAGFNLNVYGNWQNNGTFTQSPTSTVFFRGLDSVNIGGTSPTTFTNVEFQKGGAIVTLGNTTTVSGTMNLADVQLQLNQQTMTITNTSPSAISRSNDSYIKSETNAAYNPSILCWDLGTTAAGTMYTFPFGTSKTNYIPVMFTKNTANSYQICTSTRGTGADNKPYAQNQTATWTATITDAALVVDRWWDISSSVNPLLGAGAQVSLTYDAGSNTLPGTTTSVQIFHFEPTTSLWDAPYVPASTNVPVSSGTGTAQGAPTMTKFSPHVIGDPSATLPVSLVDFSAKSDGKSVLLEWQTATEIDNDYFTVERSTDAKTFESIAKVKSKQSNSDVLTYYNITDDQPIYGTSYYRLKQTDLNGINAYSKVLSVELGTALELVLAPNPTTNDNVKVIIMGESGSQVKFSMKDLEGKPVYAEVIEIGEAGKTEVALSKSKSLAVGVYICTIQVGSKIISKKLVIQ